jgi:hypothetical protein
MPHLLCVDKAARHGLAHAHRLRAPLAVSAATFALLAFPSPALEIYRTLALGGSASIITVTALCLLLTMVGLWTLCLALGRDAASGPFEHAISAVCAALPAAGLALGFSIRPHGQHRITMLLVVERVVDELRQYVGPTKWSGAFAQAAGLAHATHCPLIRLLVQQPRLTSPSPPAQSREPRRRTLQHLLDGSGALATRTFHMAP